MTRPSPLPSSDRRNVVTALLIFVALVIVTRVGALEREVISWDEGTFMIMASDLLRGHLPYVHLFDNKPPLFFAILASAFALLGESLWVTRLVGNLAIVLMVFFTFLIARRFSRDSTAVLAAATVVALSAADFGRSTMTEFIAMPFVLATIWLMLRDQGTLTAAALAGLLMSLATLTRMNLAFTTAALGAYYAAALVRPIPHAHRLAVVAYVLAGLVPLGVVLALYGMAGHLELALLSMFVAPLSYAGEGASMAGAVKGHLVQVTVILGERPVVFGAFIALLLTSVGSLAYDIKTQPGGPSAQFFACRRSELIIISIFFLGISFSILIAGLAAKHYWLQLFPFAAVLIAMGIDLQSRPSLRRVQQGLCFLVIAVALLVTLPSFVRVVADPVAVGEDYPGRRAAELLRDDQRPGDEILALSHHLVLWYLGQDPMSPIGTHPSNLTKSSIGQTLASIGYVSENEFDRVIDARPRYIIVNPDQFIPYYFDREQALRFTALIVSDYEKWADFEQFQIYRRED